MKQNELLLTYDTAESHRCDVRERNQAENTPTMCFHLCDVQNGYSSSVVSKVGIAVTFEGDGLGGGVSNLMGWKCPMSSSEWC